MCGCAERACELLLELGYQKGDDDVWRDGSGHEVPDDQVETQHFRLALYQLKRHPVETVRAFVRSWMPGKWIDWKWG